ncbi:MAG TPA: PQQ-binding-like beta-propeller repeat protein [Pyrinomonadaceae bacterium]|nr:PQQ-binding-like beta-propeller repeat protein [Pyrinomonadaceae bacterium]
MTKLFSIFLNAVVLFCVVLPAVAGDWADWRGPARDGVSIETGLPTSWSPAGDGLAWKAPYGGRSSPIVLGDKVFIQNSVGQGETLQERVMAFSADTGKLLWEHRFNVYLSDVPPHRVGWPSPVGDPATGNVYVLGVGGPLMALSNQGKLLWERSLGEDFGLLTTHGGRTVSPIVDGDLVILSGITFGWGAHSRGAHRFIAFDKKTGDTVWLSAPGGRPYDTTYAPMMIANVNGTRLLIQGASDGSVYAVKPQTGEPVWRYEVSKRGLNTGVVVKGSTAIITHSEENIDTSEMGMIAAIDAGAKGTIGKDQIKWVLHGWLGGFSSPVIDGDRFYHIDNGANLGAFDIATGKRLWALNLGTIQRASPVLADGKLYVGTENGKFFILKPGANECAILDQDQLGTEADPETIVGSVAVSRGRIFLVTDRALYSIGKKSETNAVAPTPMPENAPAGATVSHVQVWPTELIIKPGDKVNLRVRLFDERGRFIREEQKASWSLEGLKGNVADGQYTAANDAVVQAGQVKATVGDVTGASYVRVIPPLPWSEDFEGMAADTVPPQWVNATLKYVVREVEGNKVLVKTTQGSSLLSRARAYFGPANLSNYTVEVDFRQTQSRRQVGDAGVIAGRYVLTAYGNTQRLAIEPWQPETERSVSTSLTLKPDTWYRLKLQVENLADGKTRARGKVWPAAETEPSAWMIELVDTIPNRQGAPGIFGNAFAEIYFDNLKVYENK